MSKPSNFLARICITCFTYIAPALLFFYILSKATVRWNYMINQFIGWRLFNAALLVATIGFLFVHRKKIFHFLKHDSVKLFLIAGILGKAAYHEIAAAEFAVLAYALFAVAYFKSFDASFVSRIINNESRTPAIFALMCIITIPVLLILKKSSGAEQIAVYAYYFLVLTVILRILEMKLSVERDNQLLDLLREIADRGREKLFSVRRKMTWEWAVQLLFSRGARTVVIYGAVLLFIIAAQALYWKRFQRIFSQSQAYQGSITVLDQDRKLIEFSPMVEEVIVPIRLVHPFSYPLIWSSTGINPVTIRVLWYEPGKADELYDMLSEDRVALDTPLFVNESRDMLLKLKRPLLPGGRSYEVHIALMHDGLRWFATQEGSVAKLSVSLRSSRGIMPLTRELQTLRQSRIKLADAWSDRLALLPINYVSKLELLGQSDSSGLNPVKIAVTNKSKLPWPSIGSNPVQIGVIWIQKSKDQDKVIYTHRGEEVFPLAEALFPGKREIAEIRFDPFKHPDADEIWVGMVHSGKHWFYRWKDDVIKLTNKRNMSSRDLEDIESESYQVLSEAKQRESEKRALLNRFNDTSIANKDKYRSHIFVHNASSDEFMQVSAGTIVDIDLSVKNRGNVIWPIGVEKPVNIGVLWFKESNPKSYKKRIDEQRCFLPHILLGGVTADVDCKVAIRVPPGQYEMWVGPVHEGVAWFFDKGDEVLKIKVKVK